MNKLDRSLASQPVCLSNLSHPSHTWDNMTSQKKRRVWAELDKFQKKFCVYCESDAYRGQDTGHIEHFYHKENFKHLTFEWSNLFGCCSSTEHCGHYKDQTLENGVKRSYDPALLIKPDVEDPEDFLHFYSSGKIEVKDGLNELSQKKAEETIKALHLDAPSLERAREAQIARFQSRVSAVLGMLDSEDTYEFARDEYAQIELEAQDIPYRTAVKHAVMWL